MHRKSDHTPLIMSIDVKTLSDSLIPKNKKIIFISMDNLCNFRRKRFNATPNWNGLKFGVFSIVIYLSILGVIILTIFDRNHVKNTADCSPPFCAHSSSLGESPLCSGNLLDKREYHYAKNARGTYDNSRLISKLGSYCQLLHYTFEEAVGCFDALYERHYSRRNFRPSNKNLHFAFIGDSRIRQQFFNFLKLIPEYDRISQPSPLPLGYHGNMEVTSDILRLRLSFQWRPILNDTVIDTISQWANDTQSDRPNLIVIGIALWHMLHTQSADFKLYQKKLKELVPFLGQLANVSKVIWLNQFPVVESFGNIKAMNTDIFSEKIHQYNQAVRSELQNYPEMRIIWDSSNLLVEEYIRGCLLSAERAQYDEFFITKPDHLYINCYDFTHPGYSALSQATQLLFNDICNELV